MVTARGKPSGTATTTMVTPKMKKARGPSLIWSTGKPLFWMSHLHMTKLLIYAHMHAPFFSTHTEW